MSKIANCSNRHYPRLGGAPQLPSSPSLLPRITACRYSHAEREQKVSDHSPLILEIK